MSGMVVKEHVPASSAYTASAGHPSIQDLFIEVVQLIAA